MFAFGFLLPSLNPQHHLEDSFYLLSPEMKKHIVFFPSFILADSAEGKTRFF